MFATKRLTLCLVWQTDPTIVNSKKVGMSTSSTSMTWLVSQYANQTINQSFLYCSHSNCCRKHLPQMARQCICRYRTSFDMVIVETVTSEIRSVQSQRTRWGQRWAEHYWCPQRSAGRDFWFERGQHVRWNSLHLLQVLRTFIGNGRQRSQPEFGGEKSSKNVSGCRISNVIEFLMQKKNQMPLFFIQ